MGDGRQGKVGYYPIFIAGKAIPALEGGNRARRRLYPDSHRSRGFAVFPARHCLRSEQIG